MFRRSTNKPPKAPVAAATNRKAMNPSVIASNMSVLGNIISDGILDIDGQVDGNSSYLKVYDKALAQAHIAARLGSKRAELREALVARGHWTDPAMTGSPSAPPASAASSEAVAKP